LCVSKYLSVFVWTYAELCRDLRRHLRPHRYRELLRKPYPALNQKPLTKPFQKSFQKLFASLFGSLYGSKNPSLKSSANLASHRKTQPPGQSVGR